MEDERSVGYDESIPTGRGSIEERTFEPEPTNVRTRRAWRKGKESVPWKIMPRKKPSYPWWWTRSNAALRRRWESENELFNPEAFHHDRVRTLQTTLHVLERTRECRWTWRGNPALVRVDGEMGKNRGVEDLCLVERPSGKEGTDRGRDNRNCANTGDTDRGLDAIGTMGKSIRSKIKRKYRAQRAETVNALGIEEEKVQKKQAVLKGCLEAPAAHTVPSATPMQVTQTKTRVKKKAKAPKAKSWSMIARKQPRQVQMES